MCTRYSGAGTVQESQIHCAILQCQIAVMAWWQPAIHFCSAPVQRLHWSSTVSVPAQLGGATQGFLWHIYLLAGLVFFYDTWKIRIKSCQKYPFNFGIFKLPVQQVLRKLTSARQRAELWLYLCAFNFTPCLEGEKIWSWWIPLSKSILSQTHWKEVGSFHSLNRASDKPIVLQTEVLFFTLCSKDFSNHL